jgi:hypothetical protein
MAWQCLDCVYAYQTEPGNPTECHRYPPQLQYASHNSIRASNPGQSQVEWLGRVSGFPEVRPTDFCGEFRDREEGNVA